MTNDTLKATQAAKNAPGLDETEGDGWLIQEGMVSQGPGGEQFVDSGAESLTYNNPFGQGIERVWYNGKIVYALDAGELEVDEAGDLQVAQEYQIVYKVDLDDAKKAKGEPERVSGQLNIYDSVPGDENYSPIWQFNYVVVPREYEVNTLRSAQDCKESGYPIQRSNDFEN